MNFIKKIQKKPRSTRLLILWLATFLVMAIVVFIWAFSFSRNLEPKESKTKSQTENVPSLFESVKKDFSILKQRLEASVKNIEKNVEQEKGE